MNSVRLFDESKQAWYTLMVRPGNIRQSDYFRAIFLYSTGLKYKVNDENDFTSIPKNDAGGYEWDWTANIIYELI
ncbi:unnamed protein product [Rotaria socialis]|uniref:Uncharacterized protein n=1 Tax=Rotaria socialis TaxID=392032 RepID=A0A821SQV5_9BILA|nr:unnamed protein product [Rotaria socialis]CAF3571956.1 unnamed protein product [Rotaria socialis]CAF4244272.1 unnamed protein product [Rotaria socialis]CAF4371761.1 unnamed protein product [Rotaria socialis]CAF4444123.1 unnamed protein product [Rotaria socialis]